MIVLCERRLFQPGVITCVRYKLTLVHAIVLHLLQSLHPSCFRRRFPDLSKVYVTSSLSLCRVFATVYFCPAFFLFIYVAHSAVGPLPVCSTLHVLAAQPSAFSFDPLPSSVAIFPLFTFSALSFIIRPFPESFVAIIFFSVAVFRCVRFFVTFFVSYACVNAAWQYDYIVGSVKPAYLIASWWIIMWCR